MPPDFLMPEHKKIQFFGKIDSEKNTKTFIVNNNNKIVRLRYLRETPGISPVKNIINSDVFVSKNKTRGEIPLWKKV